MIIPLVRNWGGMVETLWGVERYVAHSASCEARVNPQNEVAGEACLCERSMAWKRAFDMINYFAKLYVMIKVLEGRVPLPVHLVISTGLALSQVKAIFKKGDFEQLPKMLIFLVSTYCLAMGDDREKIQALSIAQTLSYYCLIECFMNLVWKREGVNFYEMINLGMEIGIAGPMLAALTGNCVPSFTPWYVTSWLGNVVRQYMSPGIFGREGKSWSHTLLHGTVLCVAGNMGKSVLWKGAVNPDGIALFIASMFAKNLVKPFLTA